MMCRLLSQKKNISLILPRAFRRTFYQKFDDSLIFHGENNAGIVTLNRPATKNDMNAQRLG